jgi:hypothetical protein
MIKDPTNRLLARIEETAPLGLVLGFWTGFRVLNRLVVWKKVLSYFK